ncbi:thioredoxin family protein [Enterococcus cecorum]|uniref:thioredoxin family protein n=1 Tax=Enterococcus cecorum TaxID=44008 RepID=UPI0038B31F70
MFEIQDFESYQKLLDEKQTFLLYGKQVNCSVCMADFPKVDRLVQQYDFPAYFVDLGKVPMLKGQLSLFTAPVVILFHSGKEFHRQARIIDFKQLTQQLERLSTVR